MEFGGHHDAAYRVRPDDVVGRDDLAVSGHLELPILERRRGEMARDLAAAGIERRERIRMAHRDGQPIELLVVVRPELFRRRHFEQDRLHRNLHRRHRDAILLGVILQRRDLRIAREQDQRHEVEARDRAHLGVGARLLPHGDEVRQADRRHVDRARDDAVIELRRSAQRRPVDLDVAKTLKLCVLLDQLAVFHDDELDVGQAVLLADLDLADFGRDGRCERRHQCGGEAADE